MTEKAEKLSVQLNDAFARLEREQTANHKSDSQARSDEINQSTGSGIGNVIGVLLGLIAIGLGSYGAFNVYQLQQAGKTEVDAYADFEQQLDDINLQIQVLQRSISTVGESTTDQIDALSASQVQESASQVRAIKAIDEKLSASLIELERDKGTSSEDWLIAEAEYLIRLGSQRVMMEADPRGAIALLEAADAIIRDAQGIVAFDLRQALANELASLRNVADLDVDGLFVKLGALINQIDQLKQRQLKFRPMEPAQATLASEDITGQVVSFISSAGDRLFSLVDYRADGDVITPILPPNEEYYLRQNLVMKLQLAQLGLLRGDQQVFEVSLDETLAWIARYFDPQEKTTIAVVEGIRVVRSVNVALEMPDISLSLREVRKLLTRFHEQDDQRSVQ